jgi:multidrug efflux pump
MIAWLVKNRAPVFLVTFCIFIFGWSSYQGLPRESNPDVKIPVVLISTPYIGVSPEDIESLITVPLENELSGLKDLKKMSSTSAEGVSIISMEFEPEVVIEDAVQRVRDRVNRVKDLPADAEDSDIREVSFSDMPILIVTLAGGLDEVALKRIGEGFEDELKRISGVLDAKLSGGRDREFSVEIDPTRLQHYGLSLDDVIGAIANENVNVPGGEVKARDASYLLRIPGELRTAPEIEAVAVKRVGDRPVFVKDVGHVVDGFADRQTYSRMNGEPAVSIAVTKRAGANILDIADQVRELVKTKREKLPPELKINVLSDQSSNVRDMVSELENNIASALVLVVAVIIIFMGWRNALFVGVTIPLSMLISFIALSIFGITLNMVVLFSLILALGMLVDNGIVLVENVYRFAENGSPPDEAAIEGTKEIAIPVAASTATTVAAFAPMLLWTGIMGQFMGYLPKMVIIVLTASLAAAVWILPVFLARFLKVKVKAPDHKPGAFMRVYKAVLVWSIRHRYVTLFLVTASLIGTFAAYGKLNHGTEFFPSTEPDQATVAVRLPDGADLEATDRIVREIEAIIATEPDVEVFVAETGVSGGGNPMAGAQAASNQARISVDFLPHATKAADGEKPRSENADKVIDRLRDKVAEIPGAEITVEKLRMGPPVGKPIAVEVSGDDFHVVGETAAKLRRDLRSVTGVADLTDDYRVGRPEMRLRIDRGKAKRVGASTNAVAGTIRTAVAGTKASAVRDGEDEYDIVVRLAPKHREDLSTVLAMRIPGREDTSPNTFAVPLSTVASYSLAGGSGSIRHIDQKRVVTIGGDVEPGVNENDVRAAVGKMLKTYEAPPGYVTRLGGAQDEQQKTQEFLGWAFMVAVALIALILVSQFNSFTTPLIILASVILSLVGVLWGLILTGTPFGIVMTGIGVISLAGVVVNNAIVLLDYVGQLRERGFGVFESLVEAGLTRLRPVLLTAVTTVLGLVPMATGISYDFIAGKMIWGSQSADWWGPMAVAVIFGLAFATVLTLVVVPTMYHAIEDVRGAFGWAKGKLGGGAAKPSGVSPTAAE